MNHLNPIGVTESILCVQLRNQSGPATLDPMADEKQPGYMPTVDVVRIVRDHFNAAYVLRVAKRYVRRIMKRQDIAPDELINGVALDVACREILNANRRMLAAPTVRIR